MDEIVASHLQIDAFACGVRADKDAQGILRGIGVEAPLQLLAADQRSRARERCDPIIRLQIIERFSQPLFYPAPGVFILGEENEAPIVPAAVGHHVGTDPFGKPGDAPIRTVGVFPGDIEHLVDEGEV